MTKDVIFKYEADGTQHTNNFTDCAVSGLKQNLDGIININSESESYTGRKRFITVKVTPTWDEAWWLADFLYYDSKTLTFNELEFSVINMDENRSVEIEESVQYTLNFFITNVDTSQYLDVGEGYLEVPT